MAMKTEGAEKFTQVFLRSNNQPDMNLSVICNWEDGEKLSLEFLTVLGRPWQYRGEGNANIVLALQDDLRVIRLSKVKKGEEIEDWSRHRRKVGREVTFANQIFVPLLGVEYVGVVQAVQMETDQIDQLNACLQAVRPDYRLHKELKVPYATAHRDFARIHPYPSRRTDYCIEIKPKQGWWPKHLKSGINKSDPKLCTYCLNQFLKLERSKIASRTEYCPLDLFSGQPHRMIRAITALISNPQNNLRIFRDGRLVYGENMVDSLFLLLDEWIMSDPDCDTNSSSLNHKHNESPSMISNLIFLLCMALLKPKRMPQGSRFQELNERYEKLKCQIQEALLQSNLEDSSICNPNPKSSTVVQKSTLKPKGLSLGKISSCSDTASPLPEGSILSRILEIQKLADISGGVDRIYSLYRKICPVHQKPMPKQKSMTSPMFFKEENNDDLMTLPHMALARNNINNNNSSSSSELFSLGGNCYCDESGSELESLEESSEVSSSTGEMSNDDENEEEEITLTEEFKRCDKEEDEENCHENCPSVKCLSDEKWLDEIQDLSLRKDEVEDIEHYLLAATAKDCSIMVTFSPIHGQRCQDLSLIEAEADSINSLYSPTSPSITNYKDSDLILEDLNGTFHRVRIGVADLDPKPVSSIVKHYLRDSEMISDFHTYLKNNPQ